MKIIILVTLMLAGCVTPEYQHESKDSSAFNVDDYQCDIEAEQRTANTGFAGNPIISGDFWRTCMEHRGWNPVW